ncbi:MAG: hypothetical protein E1N59_2917 [Puniceicoccaceae bacterium 5H]|nr:MAG: hypothetical protein E1N59_2917 [Puniceicoccaceae bacterium 5H]
MLWCRLIYITCAFNLPLAAAPDQPPGLDSPPDEVPQLPEELKGKTPPPPPTDLPDAEKLRAQLRMIEFLLNMPPEELQRLRQSLEMIERLSPEQRQAMRLKLAEMRSPAPMPPQIAIVVQELHPAKQRRFTQWWVSLATEQRKIMLERMCQLPEPERQEWVEEHLELFEQHLRAKIEAMRQQAAQEAAAAAEAQHSADSARKGSTGEAEK